jgi:hypothetical protein
MTVVDLGAAPGSWTQVLRERVGPTGRIVAVDLLPMDPVAGVAFVQADFREDEGLAAVENALGGKPVDLVVSDMSPNLSGVEPADQARSVHLGELALDFAISHLTDGGDLCDQGIPGFRARGAAALFGRRVRQGLRPQAQVVARPESRDVPGRQGFRAQIGVTWADFGQNLAWFLLLSGLPSWARPG